LVPKIPSRVPLIRYFGDNFRRFHRLGSLKQEPYYQVREKLVADERPHSFKSNRSINSLAFRGNFEENIRFWKAYAPMLAASISFYKPSEQSTEKYRFLGGGFFPVHNQFWKWLTRIKLLVYLTFERYHQRNLALKHQSYLPIGFGYLLQFFIHGHYKLHTNCSWCWYAPLVVVWLGPEKDTVAGFPVSPTLKMVRLVMKIKTNNLVECVIGISK